MVNEVRVFNKITEEYIEMGSCIHHPPERIGAFDALEDYKLFLIQIDQLVLQGILKEVPIDNKYQKNANFWDPGKWFECTTCGQRWRLVEPDYPFRGLWEPLPKKITRLLNGEYR